MRFAEAPIPRILAVAVFALAAVSCESLRPQTSEPYPGTGVGWRAQPTVSSTKASPKVREAQRLLNRLGYGSGVADGVYGPRTRFAVLSFQASRGLAETGKISTDLLTQLRLAAAESQAEPATADKAADPAASTQTNLSGTSPALSSDNSENGAAALAGDGGSELGKLPRQSDLN